MADRKVVKSFVYGALTGAVAGAVTALLFAPKSGKELRKDISDTAQRVGEKTADLGRSAGTAAQSIARKTTNWASDVRAKLNKRPIDEAATIEEAAESETAAR
ncbi:YtxH domain-containing protein [Cohnella sp. REN36]|uniref:YtxH domain-containing protein n=1 Tax=Cohnella sp. REN36 TaxID=2887347 RepID=UPI001D149A6C|nr:YtxH domain-containing protein [Cohnella sp. REN36]MCC3373909.1 YtxH domain-containing protein [Cohnella sp. REN36]